jgi:hypothetical protein
MFVCCECCVLSGRGLCDGLITRPEESYRMWRVVVCDQETSNTRRLRKTNKQTNNIYIYIYGAFQMGESKTVVYKTSKLFSFAGKDMH